MNTKTLSLALAGAKQAREMYSEYRTKKQAELYDTIQDAKKVAAQRNAEAKKRATEIAHDVVKDVDVAVEKTQALLDDGVKKTRTATAKAEKSLKKARKRGGASVCKAKRLARKDAKQLNKNAKQLRKDASKKRKDLEVSAQKAVDRLSGKEAKREKSGRLASASLIFVLVSALIAAVVWKLRKDEKLPVDPTPVKQKAAEVKDTVADKAAEVKDTVADKAAEVEAEASAENEVSAQATVSSDAMQAPQATESAETAPEGSGASESVNKPAAKPAEPKPGQAKKPSAPKPGANRQAPKPGQAKK